MQQDNLPPGNNADIPDDATVVRQVQYAWLWSSLPWLIVIGLFALFDVVLPVVASLIAVIVLLPRYVGHRRTAYIITDENLIYQRGGLTRSQTYTLPIDRLRDVKARYGMFGRTLGYQTIDIMLDNGTLASLQYVPVLEEVDEQLRKLMDSSGSGLGENQDTDGPTGKQDSDEPGGSSFDPDIRKFDPDESSEGRPPQG